MLTTTSMKMSSKPVGRPKKLARDAAVYIARWWRCECHRQTVSKADQWIVENWLKQAADKGQAPGISDVAHVRAAVRRAKETWLKDASFILSDGWRMTEQSMTVLDQDGTQFCSLDALGATFEKDECVIVAVERTLHGRSRCLFWTNHMLEARPGKLVPVQAMPLVGGGPTEVDRQGFSPVAAAIAALVGLSRPGTIVRLHAPSNHRF